jgi:hypothetical protein
VISLAAVLGLPAIVVVLALLADSESQSNRTAARFARAVLGRAATASRAGWIFGGGSRAAVRAAAVAIGL